MDFGGFSWISNLEAGLYRVVQLSMLGSVLSNLLLAGAVF